MALYGFKMMVLTIDFWCTSVRNEKPEFRTPRYLANHSDSLRNLTTSLSIDVLSYNGYSGTASPELQDVKVMNSASVVAKA